VDHGDLWATTFARANIRLHRGELATMLAPAPQHRSTSLYRSGRLFQGKPAREASVRAEQVARHSRWQYSHQYLVDYSQRRPKLGSTGQLIPNKEIIKAGLDQPCLAIVIDGVLSRKTSDFVASLRDLDSQA
jgi:hypothetical protein